MTKTVCLVLALSLLALLPLHSEETWIAVGYGGRRLVSTDAGKTWEIAEEWAQPGGDDGNNLMSAVFAQGKFVVAGGGGGGDKGAGHILVSEDGRTWRHTLKTKNRVIPLLFGNDRFVAIGPGKQFVWSADAETWNEGAKIEEKVATHPRKGCFGNGVFVIVGNHGGNTTEYWCVVTPDGEAITSLKTDLKAIGDIVFGAGRFVMLSRDGVMMTSVDGISWTETSSLPGEAKPRWIVWTGDEFLVGDGKGSLSSTDGLEWKAAAFASNAHVKWSDGKRFIATGWPGKMSWSSDGKTWEKANELTANGINVVVKKGP
ncbi:MAG: hypothetical protein KDN20_06815 [Verrucomicrobiae bacterium]|nr:hypothetical protein [Verrucomicrobiae bacterium]